MPGPSQILWKDTVPQDVVKSTSKKDEGIMIVNGRPVNVAAPKKSFNLIFIFLGLFFLAIVLSFVPSMLVYKEVPQSTISQVSQVTKPLSRVFFFSAFASIPILVVLTIVRAAKNPFGFMLDDALRMVGGMVSNSPTEVSSVGITVTGMLVPWSGIQSIAELDVQASGATPNSDNRLDLTTLKKIYGSATLFQIQGASSHHAPVFDKPGFIDAVKRAGKGSLLV